MTMKTTKLEGNGPIDSRAKVMITDKKCGPVYLKSETIIDTYACCIGLKTDTIGSNGEFTNSHLRWLESAGITAL